MKYFHSFGYAFSGIKQCFKSEINFKVHCVAAIVAVALGLALDINSTEWILVILCIAFVLCFEMVNTVIEKLCNVVQPEKHPAIKIIKDISAAAVLISALSSITIGAIIFLPKIFIL